MPRTWIDAKERALQMRYDDASGIRPSIRLFDQHTQNVEHASGMRGQTQTHGMCHTPLAWDNKHKYMPADHHADQQLECLVPTLQICSRCYSKIDSECRSAAVLLDHTLQNADLQLCF